MLQVNPGEDDFFGCVGGFIVVILLVGTFALVVDKIVIPFIEML